MKLIMKYLSGAVFIGLLMVACNKDEEAPAHNIECRLSTLDLDSFKIQMTYNEDGSIAKSSLFYKGVAREYTTYTYAAGKITEQSFSANNEPTASSVYTLGSNGYAAQCVVINDSRKDSSFYTYDANGYLTGIRTVSYDENNGAYVYRATEQTTYTIANGNKVKAVRNSTTDVEGYAYETVNEYYTDKPGYSGLNNELDFLGKHDVSLLKKSTFKNGVSESATNYTYEFNSDGKPTKVTQSSVTSQGTTFKQSMLLWFECK